MIPESRRIELVTEKEGEEAAFNFVCQGVCIYSIAAMRDTKYGHSIKTYIYYLKERGSIVDIVITKDNKENKDGKNNLDG